MIGPLYVPSGLIVYLVVTGLLRASAQTKAVHTADALVFGPTPVIRWMLVAIIIGFAAASLYVALTPPQSLFGAALFGLISVAGTVAFPSVVLITSAGVAQVRWWGTRTAIPWKEVSRIEYHEGPARTVVISDTGTRVVHSGWNRDTDGFLRSCEERAGISVLTSKM